MPDLDNGDFLYQEDNELFLVCIGESENSYKFAVHGWREIDKERLEQYLENPERSKLYEQGDIKEVVSNEGEDEQQESFKQMLEMFETYADVDIDEDGPHEDFALEDT